MILFVATTFAPFGGGTNVVELLMDDSDVDDEVYAVDPDSWDERELWLIVWFNPGAPRFELNTGAVLVRERGP
jgi:hypothetical protein